MGCFYWDGGSYDVFIGMDWLEEHQVVLYCYNKAFMCIDDKGNSQKVKGILKIVLIRQLSTPQAKKCTIRGYQLYSMDILDHSIESKLKIEDYPNLQEFRDMFPY